MPSFINNVVTNQGNAAIAAAMAGTQMVVTRVAVGSGVATGSLSILAGLVTPRMNLIPIPPQTTANNLQNGEMQVLATLDSVNVTTTFSWSEMGVFATSGGGAEVMIAYLQCLSPYDTIATGSGSGRLVVNVSIPIVIGIGSSTAISVQAGNNVYVPPVLAGPGIQVAAPTDAFGHVISYTVSTPQILNNTNLNVFQAANNVQPNFSSVQNALNYLGGFTIASGVSVSITVAAGTYISASPINISHQNGQQIRIQGPINPDVGFTGFTTPTGSAGNWRIGLTGASSTANITVGSWLIIYNVTGLANFASDLVTGFYTVTAVSGSTVTIAHNWRGSTFPSLTGLTAISCTPITCFLAGPINNSGVNIGPNGLGLMQYFGIVPSNTLASGYNVTGLFSQGFCSLNRLGAAGYRNSVNLSVGFSTTSSMTCTACAATNNNNGFTSSGNGVLGMIFCASTHNINLGIWAESGGQAGCYPNAGGGSSSFIAGNGAHGIQVSNKSYFVTVLGYVGGVLVNTVARTSYNGQWGLVCLNLSNTATSIASCFLYSAFNTAGDLFVGGFGVSNITVQGTRIFSQTPGILTVNGVINA